MKNRLLLLFLIAISCIFLLSACKGRGSESEEAIPSISDKTEDEQTDAPETDDTTDKNPNADKKPSVDDITEQKPDTDNTPDTDLTECTQHSFGDWTDTRKSTCVFTGKAERSCNNCGYTEEKTTPKSDKHVEVIDPAVESTCSAYGKTEGKHCSHCFTVLVEQKDTPKKPHIFANGYSCSCGDFVESAKFVVLSQNMRGADDGENKMISDRAPRFKQLVEKYKPDIIGTQETTPTWNSFFKDNLKEYGMIGCSREGENAKSGEWNTILYRLDRFELIDSDNFWLSSTPDKVSRVPGSKCNRLCTWALLKDKNTGNVFIMANTHLDHRTDEVREQQIEILLDNLSDMINKYPLILTGDFNAVPDSLVYTAATEKLADARTDAIENRSTIEYTFDSYGQKYPGKIIDYCFYTKKATATWYKVANDQFGGYVSDHYGVLTQFGIK